jgi:hypothetical protein
MAEPLTEPKGRILDPVDRIFEVLFALIMVLGFTGSLSVAEAGRDDIRTMLIGALGCNLAWGIIDAVMYLMARLAEKGRNLMIFRAVRGAADPEKAQALIADNLPPLIASLLRSDELEAMRQRLWQLPEPAEHASLSREDWLGGLGVFLLVFLSTFPVVIPFMVMTSVAPAMRASNLIAISMLFVTGYAYGRHSGRHPLAVGLSMVLLGVLLSAMTLALGG